MTVPPEGLFERIVPGSVCADILLSDTQVGLSARRLCFSFQFPLQPRKANAWAILEFQRTRAKRPWFDLDGEFTGLHRRVDYAKTIDTRTGDKIETDILDVHASLLIVISVSVEQ